MSLTNFIDALTGRMTLEALPFWKMVQNPTPENIVNGAIATGVAAILVLAAIAVLALLTYFRLWRTVWFDWLTTVDHKKIGIMYIVLSFVMMLRGVVEANFMRANQAVGFDGGFLSADHFGELFTTHGTIMIFFVAMPFLSGVINYVLPLQIGARDMSFPVTNAIGLALTASGAMLVMASLLFLPFSIGGWTGYPPFTGKEYSPDVGPNYWIWAVTLSGLGTTLTGINVACTVYKKRCPGMDFWKMPLFVWASVTTAILMIFALPPLTVATAMLALDRYLDFHFFTTDAGGIPMLYANLFWLFGHPEVYILVLPAFGVWSEVFATFSGKTLYAYRTLVWATLSIAVISFLVWVHHFFTMGQSAGMNAVFGIATMLVGVPTGVKIYDWLLTMYRGRVRITTPMVYALGFVMLFVIGGASGILLANPTIDYQVHNSVFLVAHFHNMVIPGTLFGMLGAYSFWFPKAFGFMLDDWWGKLGASLWIVGFMLAFFPLYAVGLLGLPRRSVAYSEAAYTPYTVVAMLGALVVLAALGAMFWQLYISIRNRDALNVYAGDPWDGRTLEWSISSPPPVYNFAVGPEVFARDAFWEEKRAGHAYQIPDQWEDIELPANSWLAPILFFSSFTLTFGLVWHMWWLVILSLLVVVGALVARSFVIDRERTIPADVVREEHLRWLKAVREAPSAPRELEVAPGNWGRPQSEAGVPE